MEAIAATFAASAAAGGTAAAAGGAAATGILGTGISWGTALSIANAGLSIFGALNQGASLSRQSEMEEFNARQEMIRGQEEGNRIRENLLRTLAAQNAAYGASGVDTGSGTPVNVAEETKAAADRELEVSRANAVIRAASRRNSASALASDSTGAMVGGFARAGFSLLDQFERQRKIG